MTLSFLNPLSVVFPPWIETIEEEHASQQNVQQVIQACLHHKLSSECLYKEGILYFKYRIYLDSQSSLISVIVQELHNVELYNVYHEGGEKSLFRIKQVFYWKRIMKSMKECNRAYDICQKNKMDTSLSAGLLSPLPVPEAVAETFLWIL